MPSPIAAASTTSPLSIDFSKSTPAPTNAPSFASKLQDAQQNLPVKPAPAAKPTPGHRKADAAKHADDGDRPARAADDASKPSAKATDARDDAETDRPVDETGEAEKLKTDDPKAEDEQDADAAAQLALLAAAQQPAAAKDAQSEAPNDAKHAAADGAVAAIALKAAAGEAAPAAAPDADAKTPEAKASDPAAADASKKPAKLDKLTAEMKPVDPATTDVPANATHAAAKADPHGQQPQQQSGDEAAAQAGSAQSDATSSKQAASKDSPFDDMLAKLAAVDPGASKPVDTAPTPQPAQPTLRPEQQFARDNADRIVTSVQSQVSGTGDGQMRVRLDPPEIGALDVAAKMLDGKMSVSFTTTNDQATQLLSHNLGHLKSSLESAGIAVDRLEVRQAAPTSGASSSSDRDANGSDQQNRGRSAGYGAASQQQGEQQRKQLVDRLWRKYAYGSDEVDLVA